MRPMVEIENKKVYNLIENQEFMIFYSGDGYNDPFYWDFLVNKFLRNYKE
jgi:hypothetical protein